jgi:CHC2 zinc finger
MARATRAEWENWIAVARTRDIHDVAVEHGAHLKREGHEWIGPCPICGGRDRFAVNQQKRIFNCRGAGEGTYGAGDSINLVMHVTGCDFIEACERITGTPRPDRTRDESAEERKKREQRHQALAAEYAKREADERAALEAKAAADEAKVSDIIKRAKPLDGTTHADRYMRETRGLTPPRYLTGDLRFVQNLDYWGAGDNGSNEPVLLANTPALIAIIRDSLGEVIGISQTYLDPLEPTKWKPTGSPRNSPKKIRGRKHGGMIRLGRPAETIAIAEGWENALAWYQLGLGPEEVMLAAAVDLGNLSGRATGQTAHKKLVDPEGRPRRIPNGLPDPKAPGLILPQGIKSVIIIADTDSESYATAGLISVAVRRFKAQELSVEISWPPTGLDYNQLLLRERDPERS